MSTSDWADLLVEPQRVHDIFRAAPDLSECSLFYFHIDERNTSVTLGFDTRMVPDNPLPEWRKSDYNAFEFFITFTSVTNLRISGWGGSASRSVKVSRSDEGDLTVFINSTEEAISFQADSASLSRSRVYLASSGE